MDSDDTAIAEVWVCFSYCFIFFFCFGFFTIVHNMIKLSEPLLHEGKLKGRGAEEFNLTDLFSSVPDEETQRLIIQ